MGFVRFNTPPRRIDGTHGQAKSAGRDRS